MPIKLNPCAKCGGISIPVHYPMAKEVRATEFARICPKCHNRSMWKPTRKDANSEWNAANPKEGTPNE